MPRRKKNECPFTICGQTAKNGDIISVGSESLLVILDYDSDKWEIKQINAQPKTNGSAATVAPPKQRLPGNFYIDPAGIARRGQRGQPINPSDIDDILYDMRPEQQRDDVLSVVWADGVPRGLGDLNGITIAGA